MKFPTTECNSLFTSSRAAFAVEGVSCLPSESFCEALSLFRSFKSLSATVTRRSFTSYRFVAICITSTSDTAGLLRSSSSSSTVEQSPVSITLLTFCAVLVFYKWPSISSAQTWRPLSAMSTSCSAARTCKAPCRTANFLLENLLLFITYSEINNESAWPASSAGGSSFFSNRGESFISLYGE